MQQSSRKYFWTPVWQSLSKGHFSPQLVFPIGKWNKKWLVMSTVSTVSTVITRCYLHLRWYFLSGLGLLHFPFSKFTRCLLCVDIKSVLWVWNWGCFFLVGLELVHIRFSKFTRCSWCVDINAVLEIERNALVIIVLLLFLSFYLSHLIFSTSPHLTGHWT